MDFSLVGSKKSLKFKWPNTLTCVISSKTDNSYNLCNENVLVKFVVHDVTNEAYKQVKLNGNNIIST